MDSSDQVNQTERFRPSHVLIRDEAWYAEGPQQARPPDGILREGTRVRLVAENGSYSVVETVTGQTAHLASGALQAL